MNAATKENAENVRIDEYEKASKSAKEAYKNFLEARDHMHSAAQAAGVELKEGAQEQFDEAVETVKAKGNDAYKDVTDYVKEHPFKSTGIAFAAGFIASKVLK